MQGLGSDMSGLAASFVTDWHMALVHSSNLLGASVLKPLRNEVDNVASTYLIELLQGSKENVRETTLQMVEDVDRWQWSKSCQKSDWLKQVSTPQG